MDGPAAVVDGHSTRDNSVPLSTCKSSRPWYYPGLTDTHCELLAALLIVGAAVLRLVYLACNCPLDLAPDEGHYWDWSRHLDWSYYSKGPGVAWLIRLSCELFGGLSVELTGSEMLAVRFPAVVCGSLLLASMYVLTVQVSGRHGAALLLVAVALTTPVISAGSTLMTIDSPYCCCWGWALVLAHLAVFRRTGWAWWLAGVVVGLGVLFKYTMVIWVPSLVCFLLLSREHRALLWSRGFWTLCSIASLSGIPILVWNAQHDWVTFYHVFGLAGLRQDEARIHWIGPLNFVAVQCGLWLVFWFLVWARAMFANAPWRWGKHSCVPITAANKNVCPTAIAESWGKHSCLPKTPANKNVWPTSNANLGYHPASLQFLWWMSAPVFAVFFGFAFKTGGGEPNWPVTAYLSGLVLGILWMVDELRDTQSWSRRLTQAGLTTALAAGLLLVLLVHFSARVHPLLEPLAGPATAAQPFPLRRLDPTLRLRGWRDLAGAIDQLRDQLRKSNEEPVLAAGTWSMPGLLGFYCQDHPDVYSFGPVFGDRRSQYDFWRPNPVWDSDKFAGRTFLLVSPTALELHGFFQSIETHHVTCRLENGQPVMTWVILVCRGFGPLAAPGNNRNY